MTEVLQAQPDDLAAILATRYFDRLRLFATRRLRNASVGEEVAQETLRLALEALREGRIRNMEAVPAFLFETARNYCMHRQRSAGREARALERIARLQATGGSAADPLRALIAAEEVESLRRALDRLEAEDRELLLWSYRDGLDAAAIGVRLGLSPGAVRVRRHRALGRLARLIGVTPQDGREHT